MGKICAVSLALVMPLTDVLPYVTVATYAEEEEPSGSTGGNTEPGGGDAGDIESGGEDIGGDETQEPSKDELDIKCVSSLERGTTTVAKVTYKGTDYSSEFGTLTWESNNTEAITIEPGENGTATLSAKSR